mmetsp:Transcript_9073/g.27811  ORF Transcript_9073/g.27811 Transcript_9073/m.27811 type:complete len:321 (+) Transcript_9073:382-1344(+)
MMMAAKVPVPGLSSALALVGKDSGSTNSYPSTVTPSTAAEAMELCDASFAAILDLKASEPRVALTASLTLALLKANLSVTLIGSTTPPKRRRSAAAAWMSRRRLARHTGLVSDARQPPSAATLLLIESSKNATNLLSAASTATRFAQGTSVDTDVASVTDTCNSTCISKAYGDAEVEELVVGNEEVVVVVVVVVVLVLTAIAAMGSVTSMSTVTFMPNAKDKAPVLANDPRAEANFFNSSRPIIEKPFKSELFVSTLSSPEVSSALPQAAEEASDSLDGGMASANAAAGTGSGLASMMWATISTDSSKRRPPDTATCARL